MNESLSRKRPRTASTSNDPVANGNNSEPTACEQVQAATRDKDYWFEDGTIILVSQGFAFRVYRGMLAEHSSVFRSMLDIGQGTPTAADTVDGCPVVTLYDSPRDLRGLFRLIYPLSGNLKFSNSRIEIDFISAVVRLDHKYELKGLYDQAMSYLTTYYTTNFNTWADGKNASDWSPDPIHAITAINLARLTNTPSILPTAFYILCTLGPEIALGARRADGTKEQLSPGDLFQLLSMKEKLCAANMNTAYALFRTQSSGHCSNAGGYSCCADVIRKVLDAAGQGKGPHALASACALDGWMENVEAYAATAPPPPPQHVNAYMMMYTQSQRALCKGCRTYLQSRERELRRGVWRKLPEYAGVTVANWDA
ncbi:uncharacterized protein BXZ73DRAFT_53726 [Epithele typhae]|uniref:uncharacterized protein n=1 Tax=Epithele typhae TaxID=378194 RepID=UPI002008C26A|nr:uncharacterized protein BXZ73DRAFT_53726 [Epithele typhae]KAH9916613.1 hypothetical protein BXZ73DRAFT_53726 [Epithele typhae]